jgi:hypothetical protein
MQPLTKTTATILAALALLGFAGCSARGGPREPGARLVIFLDQSASINGAQRGLWLREAGKLLKVIAGGWGVTIFPIHDQTSGAAALFEADVPEWDPDATLEVAAAQKAALVRARRGAEAAVRKALESGGAARTDVFSAIDRLRPDSKRTRTVVVLFCDMLNSMPELNMERSGVLTSASAAGHIRNLARRHGWSNSQLAGVEIYCILNSVESGQSGPATDRLTQRAFYDALFRAMGARLALYDTNFGSQGFAPAKGDSYVAQAR